VKHQFLDICNVVSENILPSLNWPFCPNQSTLLEFVAVDGGRLISIDHGEKVVDLRRMQFQGAQGRGKVAPDGLDVTDEIVPIFRR